MYLKREKESGRKNLSGCMYVICNSISKITEESEEERSFLWQLATWRVRFRY